MLGLPKNLPIYAIADGNVSQITATQGRGYYDGILLEHGTHFGDRPGSGLSSNYVHVIPAEGIDRGKTVKKGDLIGYLYGDQGDDLGKLVHLHLGLYNKAPYGENDLVKRFVNPEIMYPSLAKYRAVPPGEHDFQVPGLEKTKVVIANFQRLQTYHGQK